MLAQADTQMDVMQKLVSRTKAADVLNGFLLPKQESKSSLLQLNDATTVAVLDPEGRKVIALAAVLRYSPTQAYCLLAEADDSIREKVVKLQQLQDFWRQSVGGDYLGMKVTAVQDHVVDLSMLPLFVQAHVRPDARYILEHVVDLVVEKAVGNKNLELKKNVTIDFCGDYDGAFWRDRAGFCVTDRNEFWEFSVQKQKLVKAAQSIMQAPIVSSVADSVQIQSIQPGDNSATQQHMLDYDQIVSQMNRSEYLTFLMSLQQQGATGAVALADPLPIEVAASESGETPAAPTTTAETTRVVGYALMVHDVILQCYADEEPIAARLVEHLAARAAGPVVRLNARYNGSVGAALAPIADKTSRVRRFHTRAIPSQIKWDKVHVINVGMHVL